MPCMTTLGASNITGDLWKLSLCNTDHLDFTMAECFTTGTQIVSTLVSVIVYSCLCIMSRQDEMPVNAAELI